MTRIQYTGTNYEEIKATWCFFVLTPCLTP